MLHISQGQLNLLETCPRKFQNIYLEQLGFPVSPAQQARLEFGNRFHLLMQQQEMALPTSEIGDQALKHSVDALMQSVPGLFETSSSSLRQSEHRRVLEFRGYLLTVVYDLLVLGEQQAQILDWKTYPRPQQSRWLAQNWQTRLYPFVLAETSDYEPDQISMTYWFVQTAENDSQPEQLQFFYSTNQHQKNRQDLDRLLQQLTEALERYEAGEPFPQVAATSQVCDSCAFTVRCQRGGVAPRIDPVELLNLAEIGEISL